MGVARLVLPIVVLGGAAMAQSGPRPAPQPMLLRGDAALRDIMLAEHNRARSAVKAVPLRWNPGLAANATAHATQLARRNQLDHAPARLGGEGENLWLGTRARFGFHDMVAAWTGERRLFKRGRMPDVSVSGRWKDVGHYTQIIWRGTREVGCGVASNASNEVLVCRYYPQGNLVGLDPIEG